MIKYASFVVNFGKKEDYVSFLFFHSSSGSIHPSPFPKKQKSNTFHRRSPTYAHRPSIVCSKSVVASQLAAARRIESKCKRRRRRMAEETPRSAVPGKLTYIKPEDEENRKTPQGPGSDRQQTQTPGLGMHSCLQATHSISVTFRTGRDHMEGPSSDFLPFSKPGLILVLLLCLHLHALDGKAADVALVLRLQAAFPSEHLCSTYAVCG